MRRSATVRSTGSSAVPWSAFGSRLLVDWAGRFGDARTSRIHGTFAFADVSGFTRLSEALARTGTGGAEDVNQVIDALWHRLLDVVAAFDGDVIQFGGDALALWFEDDEHPARAAACLLEMQRSLRTLGPIRTPVGPVRMRMSAGAERGMVTFVRVGSSHHDLLALGETVSTSLRCESAASRGQTIAGERLMASLDPRAVREGRLIRPWSRAPQPASVACHRARPVDLGAAVLVAPELRPLIETTGFPGEHRHVSVAFVGLPGLDALADTDGGTRIGTRGSPVVAPVERVVAAIEHAIAEYDVCWTASDVSVDAATFLLFAGVPVASEDDEERLLRVCRSILDRCEGMGVKIGCAAGPAFAGAVGTEGRRALAVLGDTVNTAARLRARAAPGELIAARSMIERSRAEFAVEWREPVALKGKRAPLAHGSVGAVLVSGRDLAGPTAVGHEDVTPMVGRDAELHDLLGRTRSHASTGSGGTVRIVGDAGSGKSRLVQELVTVAPADGHRVLRGSCDPYETTTPFFAVRRLLRAAFGVDDTTDAVTAAAQLTAWVRTRRPDLIDLLPVLASALWAAVPETDASRRIDDDQRRTRRAELAISLLATLAEPLLFVVEDVHWIDDGSKDLLDTVVTAATSRPWTVVVTSRPAGPPQTGDVQLGPLITTAAIALARTARGSAPLRNAQLRSLVERAGGNPLHIAELVAAAAERGSDAAADLDLGAPLARIVASRIDTLPTADRMLLRSVSVGGQRIDLELVARALDDPTLVRPMAWRRLRHFVTAADGQVVFRHDLFRESAYLGLAKRRRRDVHARFASLLEDRAEKSALDQLASLVALHHRGAENWQATWAWSRRAARLVESQGAWSDARTLRLHALTAAARLGLAPAERGEALVDLARVDERLDRWDEAVAGYRAARQLMPPEATVGIDLRRAAVRLRQGDFGAARRLVATVRRAGLDDEWSVRAELIAADAHRREGHLRRARTALEPLLEPARRTGDQDLLAHVLIELEIVTSELGDPVHEAYAQECERVLRDLGDDRRLGQLLLGPAWSRFVSGDWNGAADALGEAAAAFERAGSTEGAGWASNNLGELRSDQRRWAEALDALDEADRCWRGSGFALGVPLIASARGRVALRRGDLATARSELDIAAAGFARLNAVGYVVDTDLRLAELDLADGRLDEGDAALDRATARLGDLEDAPLVPLTLARLRAAMTARRDDAASAASSESATSELRRVTSLARERGVLGELLACLETLDHLGLADDGERAEALALCERLGCVSAS